MPPRLNPLSKNPFGGPKFGPKNHLQKNNQNDENDENNNSKNNRKNDPKNKGIFDDDNDDSDEGNDNIDIIAQDTKRQKPNYSFLSTMNDNNDNLNINLFEEKKSDEKSDIFAGLIFDEEIEVPSVPINSTPVSNNTETLYTGTENTISFQEVLEQCEMNDKISLFLPSINEPKNNPENNLHNSTQNTATIFTQLDTLLQNAEEFDKKFLSTMRTRQNYLHDDDDDLGGKNDQNDDILNIIESSILSSKKKNLIEIDTTGQIRTITQSDEQAKIQHVNELITTVNLIHQLIPFVSFPERLHKTYTPHQHTTSLTTDELKSIRLRDNIIIKPGNGISPYSDICKPILDWHYSQLSTKFINILRKNRYFSLFSVQQHVLPLIMSGNDVLCCANTGSGKTLAFVLPMVRYVMENKFAVNFSNQSYHWEKSVKKPEIDQSGHQIIPNLEIDDNDVFYPIDDYDGRLDNKDLYIKWYKTRQKAAKQRVFLGTTFSTETNKFITLYKNVYNPYPTTITLNQSISPHALILVPTRELALQIENEVKKFTDFLQTDQNQINVWACYGGRAITHDIRQIKNFQKNPTTLDNPNDNEYRSGSTVDIMIATPGRLIELLGEDHGRVLNLLNVGFFVIDEADRLFDLGFEFQLDLIIKALPTTVTTKIYEDVHEEEELKVGQNERKMDQNGTIIAGNQDYTMTDAITTAPRADSSTEPNLGLENEHDKNTEQSTEQYTEQKPHKTPPTTITTVKRQTLLFSATFPYAIERIARKIMTNPTEIQVNNNKVNSNIFQAYIPSYDSYSHRNYYSVPKPLDISLQHPIPTTTIQSNQHSPIPAPFPLTTIPINSLHRSLLDVIPPPTLNSHNEYRFYQLLSILSYWVSNQLDIWYYYYYLQLYASYPGVEVIPQLNPHQPSHVISYKVYYTPPLELLQAQWRQQNENKPNGDVLDTTMPTVTKKIDITDSFMAILKTVPELKHRGKVIIFVESKSQVDELVIALRQHSFKCLHVHGDQPQVDRDDYLEQFKTGGCVKDWENDTINSITRITDSDGNNGNNGMNNPALLNNTNKNGTNWQLRNPVLVRFNQNSSNPTDLSISPSSNVGSQPSDTINDNKYTYTRYNNSTNEAFYDYPNCCDILITTSILSRGIDVPSLSLVINYECPTHYEDYIHRVGRTGRGEHPGFAMTFMPYDTPPRHVIEILKDEYNLKQKAISMGKNEEDWNRLIDLNTKKKIVPKMDLFDPDVYKKESNEDERRYLRNQGAVFSIINHISKDNFKLEQLSEGIGFGKRKKIIGNDKDKSENKNKNKHFENNIILLNALPLTIPSNTGYIHLPKTIQIVYLLSRYQVHNGLVRFDNLSAYKSRTKGFDKNDSNNNNNNNNKNLDKNKNNNILRQKKRAKITTQNDQNDGNNNDDIDYNADNNDNDNNNNNNHDDNNNIEPIQTKILTHVELEEKRQQELRQKFLLKKQEEEKKRLEKEQNDKHDKNNTNSYIDNQIYTPNVGPNALVLSNINNTNNNQLVETTGSIFDPQKGFRQKTTQTDHQITAAMKELETINQSRSDFAICRFDTKLYSPFVKSALLSKVKLLEWMNTFNVVIEKQGNAQHGTDYLTIKAKDSINPNCRTIIEKKSDEKNNVEKTRNTIEGLLNEKMREEQKAKQARNLTR